MYAIFEAKGKQFRAEPEGTLRMPSIDAEPGERLTFDRVLLAELDGGEILVGRPSVDGASISAEVVRHGKGEKIVVYKMKRRKGYRRKQGHRQQFTEVRIVEIDLEDATAPDPEAEVAEPETPEVEAPEAEVAREVAPEADEVVEPEEEEPEAPEPEAEAEPEEAEEADEADETEVEAAEEEEPEVEAAEEGEPEVEAAEEGEPEAVIPEDVAITGAARKIAEEHGLDVTKIEGTGQDGRILKADAEAAVEEQKSD